MDKITRRDFLTMTRNGLLALSGLLGLGGLLKFMSYQTESAPPNEIDLGPVSDFPLGSEIERADIPAVIRHTENGFSALSLICPHLGCTVAAKADGFACPCHGSHFDAQGDLMHGPSAGDLQSLNVEQTPEGRLILHLRPVSS